MFKIFPNHIIQVNRGDTFQFPFEINLGTALYPDKYILQENDVLYLGVCEPNQCFENAIIKKKFTKDDLDENGNVIINFSSSDTEYLSLGVYYYEIKLLYYVNNIENIITLLPKTIFNIYN